MRPLIRFRRLPQRYQLRLTELFARRRSPRVCATAGRDDQDDDAGAWRNEGGDYERSARQLVIDLAVPG
jgi:hypothetical protein